MKKLGALLLLVFLAAPCFAQNAVPAPLSADTPKTTVAGNAFIAPAGWTVTVKGPATLVAAPEGDSWIALVDVDAKDADAAVGAAWAAYKPDHKWPLKVTNDVQRDTGFLDAYGSSLEIISVERYIQSFLIV